MRWVTWSSFMICCNPNVGYTEMTESLGLFVCTLIESTQPLSTIYMNKRQTKERASKELWGLKGKNNERRQLMQGGVTGAFR